MSLTKKQLEELEDILLAICSHELGILDRALTQNEKHFLNPKVYTKEPSVAYTDYEIYTGSRKNVNDLYIFIFDTVCSYSYFLARKNILKKTLKSR